MPPLTGPPSSSMSTYRGTTDRHAAARVGTADASTQAGTSALLSSRRAYWTNEQQQLQQSFERDHSHRQELLQLPYPTPPAAERPPPVSATVPIHRVYILRCATCDTFLSDRGMRVSAFSVRSRLTGMLVASLLARVIKQRTFPKRATLTTLLPAGRPAAQAAYHTFQHRLCTRQFGDVLARRRCSGAGRTHLRLPHVLYQLPRLRQDCRMYVLFPRYTKSWSRQV